RTVADGVLGEELLAAFEDQRVGGATKEVGRPILVLNESLLLPLVEQRAQAEIRQAMAGQVLTRRRVVRIGRLEDEVAGQRGGNHSSTSSAASCDVIGSLPRANARNSGS